ncbi:MAG: hypothetical protein HQM13_20295 [SAR324 cluster bacterium]|nr:hypothetical protein [SAR324 cluster bacterium]
MDQYIVERENIMEAMLLGFCLISLILSSIIVAIELGRDRRKQKTSNKPKANKNQQKTKIPSLQGIVLSEDSPPPEESQFPQKKMKVLNSLNKQLIALGYVSSNQQLGFINRVLKSQRSHVKDIDANEIRHLFKVIRRYTGPTPPVLSSKSAQDGLAQTAPHI